MNFEIPGLRRGVNVMNGVDPFAVEGPAAWTTLPEPSTML